MKEKKTNSDTAERYMTGFRDGLPIALGYLSVSFTFGITAVSMGLPPLVAVLISMTNLTSAGQLAGVTIIAAGGGYLEMAMAQLIINLRYALMSLSLSQKLNGRYNLLHRIISAFTAAAALGRLLLFYFSFPSGYGDKLVFV